MQPDNFIELRSKHKRGLERNPGFPYEFLEMVYMMNKKILSLTIAIALSAASATVMATPMAITTTLGFNALEVAGSSFTNADMFSEGGANIHANGGTLFSANQNKDDWYYGSAGVFNDAEDGQIILSMEDGRAFTLNTISLAPMSNLYGIGAEVLFVGNKLDGSTVSNNFTITKNEFNVFGFSGFDNLSSVSWTQTSPFHQFDNINFTAEPAAVPVPSVVPEPASSALLLAGFLMLTGMLRRRTEL